MAWEKDHVVKVSLKAAADLSSKQYYFVKLDSNGDAALCSAATDIPLGVLQNEPGNGETAEVLMVGISKVSADAALTIGWLIGTSADGQADRKIPGTDTTEYVVGQVITSTSAAAGLATCSINCMAPHRAA